MKLLLTYNVVYQYVLRVLVLPTYVSTQAEKLLAELINGTKTKLCSTNSKIPSIFSLWEYFSLASLAMHLKYKNVLSLRCEWFIGFDYYIVDLVNLLVCF